MRPFDSLKQTVRLAAGLRPDGTLDAESQTRGLRALAQFGERLRSFAPETVRAVATNTLRVARNADHFLDSAEAALGFPIEVISGHEEARLIYLGAAHALASDGQQRLVIDIGGGSTECIIGVDRKPIALESAPVGCVALTQRVFADGHIDRDRFEHAYYLARGVFAPLVEEFRRHGWRYASGTSGTAKALAQIAEAEWGASELDREALARMHAALIEAGDADSVALRGLKPERRPVLAGGLAIMMAAFDELGIDALRYCNGALRHGVLYDLLGRDAGDDIRALTVEQMMGRYAVDAAHAQRVHDTALALFDQGARGAREELETRRRLLGWAARLAEVGRSISHEGFHKHSAYILQHADMPGFSRGEQDALARLALAQTGGLRKLRLPLDDLDWLAVVALRVAAILHGKRDAQQAPLPALFFKQRKLRIEMPAAWARQSALAHDRLRDEAQLWREAAVLAAFAYETI
ncbi:MAG: exopolyphosphatase [Burkholderiaceae bacterium]